MIPLRDQNPTRRLPVVTWALIAANVLAYLWEAALVGVGHRLVVFEWGLVPARFLAAPLEQLPTVLTSMFMHAPDNWWHLGGNMLFLWVFGDNVEDALGRWRYLGFYLLSGLAAALAQVAVDPSSLVPMVGASGAIAGVLAAYGSLYPRAPVVVLNPLLPLWLFFGPLLRLPAWLIIAEFFVLNLLSGMGSLVGGSAGMGGVAFFAHLGGFVAGLLLIRLLVRRQKPTVDPWEGWRPPPRMRPPRTDPYRRAARPHFQAYPPGPRRWR